MCEKLDVRTRIMYLLIIYSYKWLEAKVCGGEKEEENKMKFRLQR